MASKPMEPATPSVSRLLGAEHVDGAGQAHQGAGHGQHQEGGPGRGDAGDLGGARVGAHRTEVEADGGAAHQPPQHDGRTSGEEQPCVEAESGAQQQRQHRVVADGGRGGLGLVGAGECRGLQREEQQIGGDPVQHDGADDLIGAEAGLEESGDAAPDATGEGAGEQADQQVDDDGQVEGEAHVPGGHGAGDQLAGAADVEQARAEGDGHSRRGDDQRRGDGEGLGKRAESGGERRQQHVGAAAAGLADALGGPRVAGDVEDRAAEHGAVGLGDGLPDGGQGVAGPVEEVSERCSDLLVGDHDQHGADQESEHEAHHHDQQVAAGDLLQGPGQRGLRGLRGRWGVGAARPDARSRAGLGGIEGTHAMSPSSASWESAVRAPEATASRAASAP